MHAIYVMGPDEGPAKAVSERIFHRRYVTGFYLTNSLEACYGDENFGLTTLVLEYASFKEGLG